VKLTNRHTQFTMDLPGFGPATFITTEDAVINDAGVGTTHGTITVTLANDVVLVARSTGKVYPVIVGTQFGIGFHGRIATIGQGNQAVHVTGTYEGYFLPDDPQVPISGDLHMSVAMQLN
jgi:hypothetical protein